MQKSMDLVDEFGRGNCGENEARKISTLMKGPTGADYQSSNHNNYAVSNFAKIVSNYLTQNTKRTFDQLRQAFIEVPIL